MQNPINYIKHPSRFLYALLKKLNFLFSDKVYLQLAFLLQMDKPLNLKNPMTFNEKLQWLKLYNRRPEYPQMVDKLEAKRYVARLIGEEYIVPTLGVWDSSADIDFDALPDKFVLKTTHSGGSTGVVICTNKSTFDRHTACKRLEKSLRINPFLTTREWVYKGLKARIIAEPYLCDTALNELRDYKFFCFNGQCKCFKIDFDRFIEHHANYYDTQGKILSFGEEDLPPILEKKIELPLHLQKMITLAEKLSTSTPFLRTDFYEVDKQIYFGELTFFPASGLGKFTPKEWDIRLGGWLHLPRLDARQRIS